MKKIEYYATEDKERPGLVIDDCHEIPETTAETKGAAFACQVYSVTRYPPRKGRGCSTFYEMQMSASRTASQPHHQLDHRLVNYTERVPVRLRLASLTEKRATALKPQLKVTTSARRAVDSRLDVNVAE